MKKTLLNFVAWSITAICLFYSLSNIDYSILVDAFKRYDISKSFILILLYILILIMATWRKKIMLNEGSIFIIFKGVLLNYTANNIFPAKAGDILHTFYLAKELNTNKTRLLHIVAWERFADLNIMLVMISLLVGVLNANILYILIALLSIAWCIILILKTYPSIFAFVLSKFSDSQIKKILFIIQSEFQAIKLNTLVKLLVVSALSWLVTYLFYIYAFLYIAELHISYYAGFVASIIVSVASIIPSSPGALGVFEASTIFGLGQFGVSKEEALAIAVLVHFFLYIIPLILSLIFFRDYKIFGVKK